KLFDQAVAVVKCVYVLIFEEAEDQFNRWRPGGSTLWQRAEEIDLLFSHFLPQLTLDECRNHLRNELQEYQSLDAGVLLQPDRGDLERRFEQRMSLLDPGLVLVDLEHVDGLLLGIRGQREDPIHG